MKVRLGYACISKTLDITTSKTYTYTKYKETKDNKKTRRNNRTKFI